MVLTVTDNNIMMGHIGIKFFYKLVSNSVACNDEIEHYRRFAITTRIKPIITETYSFGILMYQF